ncbi:MAG TPA: hypothetical protein VFH78_09590 [Candidatus Thermoplasmatota archaeon]|nr:hypothetical protein [Candidatus Thermoplasmatota archaeon]
MRALTAALLLSLLLSGCASDGPASTPTPTPPASVEIVDVHGLALDPTDASILYVATHRGLLRLDGGGWSYVGEARDDFMGFSAHPSDPRVFWASGHPRSGGNLGILRSDDGGITWRRIALEGVDAHAMAVSQADPQRLYVSWRGEVLRSDDGGATWAARSRLPVAGFATHPTERDVVLAATGRGLYRSVDGGDGWQALGDVPTLGVAFDPTAPTTLYAGTATGILRSVDDGRTWTPLALPHAGAFAHFATHAQTPGLLYAASYQKGIYRSGDGGATWSVVLPPPS